MKNIQNVLERGMQGRAQPHERAQLPLLEAIPLGRGVWTKGQGHGEERLAWVGDGGSAPNANKWDEDLSSQTRHRPSLRKPATLWSCTQWAPAPLQPGRVARARIPKPHLRIPKRGPGERQDVPHPLGCLSPDIGNTGCHTLPISLISHVTCWPSKASIFTTKAKTWLNCLAPTL